MSSHTVIKCGNFFFFSLDLDQQLRALTADTVSGRKLVEKSSDVLLGSTTIPLMTLLSHRTGK